jgi:hypothetical protein
MSNRQYFVQSGLDPSALSTITAEQLLQMFSQMVPLSNISFNVKQAGTNADTEIPQGTLGSPSVDDTPEFARFVWLNSFTNPPTPYYYDSVEEKWKKGEVPDASITTDSITDPSTTGGVPLDKLKAEDDDSAVDQFSPIRIDATGTRVEVTTLTEFLNDGGRVPLNSLSTTGKANGKFIVCDSNGNAIWSFVALDDIATLANSKLNVTNILAGTAKYIVRTNAAGSAVEFINTNAFLQDNDVTLANIYRTGASQYQVPTIQGDGTLAYNAPSKVYDSGSLSLGTTNGSVVLADTAHGLGGYPDTLNVFLVAKNATYFNVADFIPIRQFMTGSLYAPYVDVWAGNTNVACAMDFDLTGGTVGSLSFRDKAGTLRALTAAQMNTNFYVRIIATRANVAH